MKISQVLDFMSLSLCVLLISQPLILITQDHSRGLWECVVVHHRSKRVLKRQFIQPLTRELRPRQKQTAVSVVVAATSEEIPRWKPKGKFPLFPLWNEGCAVFLQGFPLFWRLVGENSPWPALIPGSIQGQDVEVNHTYKHDSVHLDEYRSR